MVLAAFGCTVVAVMSALAPARADDGAGDGDRRHRAEAVGGSLAGWGAVPIADDDARAHGVLDVWGQLQVWTTIVDQDVDPQADPATYGDPEADPGFTLRRARIGIDGYLPMKAFPGRSQVDYAFALGVGAPYDVPSAIGGAADASTVEIVDAFGRWALPTGAGVTSLAFGLQRAPFSRESGMSSADLVFEEVAVGTEWLAPSRELGVVAGQSVVFKDGELAPQVLLRGGLYNGGGDLVGDEGPGLLGTLRAEFSAGDTYRTWSADGDPALGVGAAFLRDGGPSTRTTSIEADLIGRFSLVTAMGELVSSTVEPTATDIAEPGVVTATSRIGWLGQLSVFVPVAKGRGSGIEVAGRYASYDDDTSVDTSGDVGILHAGATWRNLLPRVDVGAGYIHRIEVSNAPNDTIRVWTQVRPQIAL